MKHITIYFYSKVLIALVLMIFVSCSKKERTNNQLSGKLDITVGVSVATSDIYNNLKAADLNEFMVIIYNLQDEIVEQYDRVADIPDLVELPGGDYYIVSHSNNNLPAEFDNPYYSGSSEIFTIVAGETTSVTITCILANVMVTVIYSQNVIQDFSDYSTAVSNTAGSLVFGSDELRAGFFNAGPLHIESNLYFTDGQGNIQSKNLSGDIGSAEPGKHYEIHIDASLTSGTAIINLNVDETYDTEIITISDEEAEMSGELLITEIMYNPLALSDTDGEYFELKNVSEETINLMDLVIRRGSNNDIHVISDDLSLFPGEIVLLGRSSTAASEVDYVYSNIALLNSGDEIYINTYGTNGTDGSVICMVDYGDPDFNTSLNGISIQLDPSISDVNNARLGTNWCESTSAYSTGDLGSPGLENASCQ
ncbi:hypothetical protein ES705_10400 [subsurface metagenome]